jgi:hypothetical protein
VPARSSRGVFHPAHALRLARHDDRPVELAETPASFGGGAHPAVPVQAGALVLTVVALVPIVLGALWHRKLERS